MEQNDCIIARHLKEAGLHAPSLVWGGGLTSVTRSESVTYLASMSKLAIMTNLTLFQQMRYILALEIPKT